MSNIVLKNEKLNSRELVSTVSDNLLNLSPRTKDEAITGIHLVKQLEKAAAELKKKSTDFLLNRCADCVNHISGDSTLEVTYVERNEKVYNDSSLDKMLEEKKKLDNQIKTRKALLWSFKENGDTNKNGEEYVVEQLKSKYFKT